MPVPRQPYGPASSQQPGSYDVDVLAGVADTKSPPSHTTTASRSSTRAQLAVDARRLDRIARRPRAARPSAAAPRPLGVAQPRDPRLVVGARPGVLGEAPARIVREVAGRRPPRRRRGAARRSARVDDVHDLRVAEAAERRAGSRAACRRRRRRRPRCLSSPRVRLNASSWSAGRQPRPRPLTNVGTRRCSTAARERVPRAVPVHVAAGDERRAARRRRSASAAARPRRGRARRRAGVRHVGQLGLAPCANTTSSGKSRNTGPRCGVSAVRDSVVHDAPAMSPVACTVAADFVIGASDRHVVELLQRAGAPARACGARPPSTTSGEPLNGAVVTALTPFVTPGPAVSTATPGRRVSLAIASAANVAVCSWRTSTRRTPLLHGRVVEREDVAAREREQLRRRPLAPAPRARARRRGPPMRLTRRVDQRGLRAEKSSPRSPRSVTWSAGGTVIVTGWPRS